MPNVIKSAHNIFEVISYFLWRKHLGAMRKQLFLEAQNDI